MTLKDKGKFIVLEGIEGAGKTTAQQLIASILQQWQITDILFTREPGGTPIAEKLRDIVKHSIEDEVVTDKAELLLLYAARIQLVDNVIKPALANGTWVIADRHDMSSQAYQGGGRQMDLNLLNHLKQLILENFQPDLVIYLDIEPTLGLQRAKGRGTLDRIEQQHIDFFTRTRNKYLQLMSETKNGIIIDANQDLTHVSNEITVKLTAWLQQQL